MPARAALLASPRGDSRPPRPRSRRAAAGRQARCGGPWGAKLAPAAHIFDVCVVYTVCTPAPVPSVPTREALMPVFAPCPDWLGGGSRLACNRSSHDGRPTDHSWVALPPVSLDVLSTACRQRHIPCGARRVSTSTAYPAFECILAVVPHPLVSISETAGGHEGRWECQPHNA